MKTYAIHRFLALFCLLCFVLAACSQTGPAETTTATTTSTVARDFYGVPIAFPQTPPRRIISLVANMSEILGALHLDSRVVGVDAFTDYPPALATRTKIADENENYNVEQIVSLKPDLVLSWGGETKQIDPQLSKLGLHVVDFPVSDFSQTLQQIIQVGRLTGTQQTATTLVNQLEQQVNQIKATVAGTIAPRTLLEVDDTTPGKLYVFGGSSFGDDLAQDAHAQNIFHSDTSNSGYPQITYEAVLHADPQFIILTEDPQYGGKPAVVYARSNWQDVSAVKAHHVYHINVELMQRPGPRLVQGLRCLAQIVHPDKFTGALPAYCA